MRRLGMRFLFPQIFNVGSIWQWLLVTLSEEGAICYEQTTAERPPTSRTDNCGVSSIVRQKMPAFFEGMGMSFENACIFYSRFPFCLLPINSSLRQKKEHRAHCSIDMLGIGSALYKTPLKRRFGILGVKQADSSHTPHPAGRVRFCSIRCAHIRKTSTRRIRGLLRVTGSPAH